MADPQGVFRFRSELEREALRDALNAADPLAWAVRDSIYYGVYLRAWHARAGKLRIFGDRPHYLLDMGDDPPPEVAQEIGAFIQERLVPAARAVPDPDAPMLLPFLAGPLDLHDDNPPRQRASGVRSPLAGLAEMFRGADSSLTVVAFQVGTPATFYSDNPAQPAGHHFDSCGVGTTDAEIDLHSPELVLRMLDRMPAGTADQRIMRGGKWAFFKNEGPSGFYRVCPELAAIARVWGEQVQRDFEFRLRMALTPVSSIKTPGAGGPIELFRIQ